MSLFVSTAPRGIFAQICEKTPEQGGAFLSQHAAVDGESEAVALLEEDQPAPTVTAGPPLVITGEDIPAGGTAVLTVTGTL